MARPRKPIELLKAEGKSHMTKEQIAEREETELKVPFKDVSAPDYLSAKQQKEFNSIADKLLKLNIFTELDVDVLAQYCIAKELYLNYCDQLKKVLDKKNMVHKWSVLDSISEDCGDMEELKKLLSKIIRRQRGDDSSVIMGLQDKAFKQCMACASKLGLTITDRARMVVPTPPEDDDDEL